MSVSNKEVIAAVEAVVRSRALYGNDHHISTIYENKLRGINASLLNDDYINTEIDHLQNAMSPYNQRPPTNLSTRLSHDRYTPQVINNDMNNLINQFRDGKVLIYKTPINDFNAVKIIAPQPSRDEELAHYRGKVSLNSSCLFDIINASANFTNDMMAESSLRAGANGFHFHQPAYDVNITLNNVYAHPIPVVDAIHGGLDPLSKFTDYPSNHNIPALWTNSNLDAPPNPVQRGMAEYVATYGNMETLPSKQNLIHRLSQERYDRKVYDVCRRQYQWLDGGDSYLMNRQGLHSLMPGNWQAPVFMASQAHHYNRQVKKFPIIPGQFNFNFGVESYSGIQNSTASYQIRSQRLLQNMNIVRDYNMSGINVPILSEEGQNMYCASDFFNGWNTHLLKDDRETFNRNRNGEFNKGFVVHYLRNQDCVNAHGRGLDITNGHGLEMIIRFTVPLTQYASYHVINGPPEAPVSGAKFIKFFDCFRPMPVPELWWFVVL